jgi:hypothetical protein
MSPGLADRCPDRNRRPRSRHRHVRGHSEQRFHQGRRPSPDGDRPSLLVGGFLDTGSGSHDLYQIYGNLFVHNPREALFQGSGRISVHDNILVGGQSAGAVFLIMIGRSSWRASSTIRSIHHKSASNSAARRVRAMQSSAISFLPRLQLPASTSPQRTISSLGQPTLAIM